MAVVVDLKPPGAVLDYGVDWRPFLGGDSIVTSVWTAQPGVTLTSPTHAGGLTKVLVGGGVEGSTYRLTNSIVTATGRTQQDYVDVEVGTPVAVDLIVSVDELRDYMSDIILKPGQLAAAARILAGVQRELERYCNRPLTRRERTETIRPDEDGRLWPTATPVVSVSTLGYTARHNEITGGYGLAGGLGGAQSVTVTYVGGIDGRNEADVAAAIFRIAAREVTTRHDDTMSIKDLTARNEGEPVQRVPLGLTDDEAKKLDRLRRRTIV